jgi:hypothetical protein
MFSLSFLDVASATFLMSIFYQKAYSSCHLRVTELIHIMKYEDKRSLLEAMYTTHEDVVRHVQFNTKLIHDTYDNLERLLDAHVAQMSERFEEYLQRMKDRDMIN